MSLLEWFDWPTPSGGSHAAGDDGDDVDAPDNTPLWFPWPGTIIDASYHDYGGQVVEDLGNGWSEYFIHMNQENVHPGEQVLAGQLVGTSGGGVGDLVLHNGKVQPAQSQSWYDGHSTGYHTEYGIFEGDTMNQFNEGWGNHSRQLDPTGVLHDLQQGLEPHWPGTTPPTGNPANQQLNQSLSSNQLGNPIPQVNVGEWPDDIAKGFGFINAANMMSRLTVGAAGVGAIGVAIILALQPEAQAAAGAVAKAAAL